GGRGQHPVAGPCRQAHGGRHRPRHRLPLQHRPGPHRRRRDAGGGQRAERLGVLMVQLPAVPESATREAVVETPLDDYELLDFGAGRRLERWGPWVVDRPDRLAGGAPRLERWAADWAFVARVGREGEWRPARADLPSAWSLRLQGERVECRLDRGGRVG